MFGINDRNDNLVKNGLLELHLGRTGATMNIGMGGADVSLGTIAASMSGLRDTLKIGGAKLASLVGSYEGISTLNAVNMLGYTGDDFNITLGSRIWKGGTKVKYTKDLKASEGNYGAYDHKEPDEVMLSNELLGNGKEQAAKLASVMAHEGTHVAGNRYEAVAYKQSLDTYQSLLTTFGLTGDRNFSLGMVAALLDPRSYEANTGTVDNFEIMLDGTIVGTPHDAKVYRPKYTIDGQQVREQIPGSPDMESQAAAVVSIFGKDRVLQKLGPDAYNIETYDNETLRDVLGWDDEAIAKARIKGGCINADEGVMNKLLGEALLKKSGYVWSQEDGTWLGDGLNIAAVPVKGNVGVVYQDGAYIPFSITARMDRKAGAINNLFRKVDGEWKRDEAYLNNTTITMTYTDLRNGSVNDYTFEGGINFVDNLISNGGKNQEYQHLLLGTIQGATVAAGNLEMRMYNPGQWDVNNALLLTNYLTIAADWFGENGRRAGIANDPRTWIHPWRYGSSDSCGVNYDLESIEDLGKAQTVFNNNMNYLINNFNLYPGYSIQATLFDTTYGAYPGLGRKKGAWY
jgi:hypothetical protein